MIKKRYGLVLAIAMVFPGIAMAGLKYKQEVTIDTHSWVAQGSMGAARNSRDSIQRIGCWTGANREAAWGFCLARDATGVERACITNNERLARTMAALSDSAHLNFGWNEFGECAIVEVHNSSVWEPRK